MYLICEDNGDGVNPLFYTLDESLAKDYSNTYGNLIMKIESLPDKSSWPKIIKLWQAGARIYHGKIKTFVAEYSILESELERRNTNEYISENYIHFYSLESRRAAEEILEKQLKQYRVVNKPTSNGYIESRFELCK